MKRTPLFVVAAVVCLFLATPSKAVPEFARKYNVTCNMCHTFIPRLNETGYMFKRLGYRMPPDISKGKEAVTIKQIDDPKWELGDTVALVVQGSVTGSKSEQGSDKQQSWSFNLDNALLFLGGTLPKTNFSYLAEYKLYEDGESGLETGYLQYEGGRASGSWFARLGKMHLQETEGFRASDPLGFTSEGPLMFTWADPNSFSLDQAPVGAAFGFTHTCADYKGVLGLTLKVTNGLAADGSEITQDSQRKKKDIWFEGDYLFGTKGAISVMAMRAYKDQIQNAGTEGEFTFQPTVDRYGIFGNIMPFGEKLDLIGAWMHGKDDWQDEATGPALTYKSDSWYGEVNYYIDDGLVAVGRYDRLKETIDNAGGDTTTQAWTVAVLKALTDMGNVRARLEYRDMKTTYPAADELKDKQLRFDVLFGW